MARVFLSYAREDIQVAERLFHALRRLRHEVYFDTKSLTPDESYVLELNEQVKRSDLFVYLISPDSVSPESYTRKELDAVAPRWAGRTCAVVAAMIRPTDENGVPPFIQGLNYLKPEGDPIPDILLAALGALGAEPPPVVEPSDAISVLSKLGAFRLEAIAVLAYLSVLPRVRIATLILGLLLIIYLGVLTPGVIHGDIFDDSTPPKPLGGRIDYYLGYVSHNTTFEANHSGKWTVPVGSSWPVPLPLTVKIAGQEAQEIKIPFAEIVLARFMPGRISLRAAPSREGNTSSISLKAAPHTPLATMLPSWLLREAWAQPRAAPTDAVRSDSVPQQVLQVARGLSSGRDVKSSDRIDEIFPNAIRRSGFLLDVEFQLQVRLPPEVLTSGETLGSLATVVEAILTSRANRRRPLVAALTPFAQGRDIWVEPQEMPNERVWFAKQSMDVPNGHINLQPIAFFDATLLGRGDEGILFMPDGVYYRTSWTVSRGPRAGYIPYEDFRDRTFSESSVFQVSLDRGQFFVTAGSGVGPRRLVELLNAVKGAAQAVMPLESTPGRPKS